MKNTSLLITSLAAGTVALHAAESPAPSGKTAAYQGSVSEEQLRVSTRRVNQDLADLMKQYGRYSAAGEELSKLKEAIGTLDGVTARDMPAVVDLLMAASRNEDAAVLRDQLAKANGDQKEIQGILRAVADKLIRHAEQAALQKRLEDLAARQSSALRTTRDLAEKNTAPKDLQQKDKNALEKDKAEQAALARETKLADEALRQVAREPDSPTAKQMNEALAASENKQLETRSQEAAKSLEQDLPKAAQQQQEALDALKAMVASLDETKSREEQARDLAAQVNDLAKKEENLANRTPKLRGDEQAQARKEQQDIASQLDVAKDRLGKLNPEAGAKAAEDAAKSDAIAKDLGTENLTKDAQKTGSTTDAQKDLAKDLAALGEKLEKQADALAAAEPGAAEPSPSEKSGADPAQAAIRNAMKQVMDAESNLAVARLQTDQGQSAQARANQAQQDLAAAGAKAAEAGKAVGEHITKKLAEAAEFARVAAGGDQVQQNLDRSRNASEDAMRALQEASNQLALADQNTDREATRRDGELTQDRRGGPGSTIHGKGGPAKDSEVSALSKASDAKRDALSMLKQEKVAPEYEPMVNQYIKNLAEEDDDGR